MTLHFGSKGPRGYDGVTGAKGDTGDTGAKGDKGDQGDPGMFNYTDRGDVAGSDYNEGDLTIDSSWNDLDLSAIVGAAQRLVLLHVRLNALEVGKRAWFRTNGNSNEINVEALYTKVASAVYEHSIWVLTDASGVIEYNIQTATWGSINLTVKGWCE